jgi:hypothetical protein
MSAKHTHLIPSIEPLFFPRVGSSQSTPSQSPLFVGNAPLYPTVPKKPFSSATNDPTRGRAIFPSNSKTAAGCTARSICAAGLLVLEFISDIVMGSLDTAANAAVSAVLDYLPRDAVMALQAVVFGAAKLYTAVYFALVHLVWFCVWYATLPPPPSTNRCTTR